MTTLCLGTTKSGNPCKSKPLTGSDYCGQHQVVERVEEVEEPKAETPDDVCGHQNLHYYGDEPMFCDLPKGHEGVHGADYYTVDYSEGSVIFDGIRRGQWSDEACTPASEIKQDYDALAKLIVEREIRRQAEKLAAQA